MAVPLVCPGCRTRSGDRLDVRTLFAEGALLACECGRRYPVVDGIPLVLADPTAMFHHDIAGIVEGDLPLEVSAALVAHGPDDAPYARMLEHLSTYLDTHWGDLATPPLALGSAAILERLRAHTGDRVGLAIELGCSVGRGVAELARSADHVVGLDLHIGALRRARRVVAGAPLAYNRRIVGRHYAPATLAAGERAVPARRTTWLCGDALDPPLLPAAFDRVVALNLLDALGDPAQLLAVLDGLCAPGGQLILASPYAWQSGIVDEHARLGGADPAAVVRDRLRATGYAIDDDADLPWTVRRDARSVVSYQTHWLVARKPT